MSARRSAGLLKDEHVRLVIEVRDANLGLGLARLAPLVAAHCGLSYAPPISVLYRFMRKHGIECLGYNARPTGGVVKRLADEALAVAIARQRPLSSAWPEGFERATLVGDVCSAFQALLFRWAQDAGVPHVDQVAEASREWLAEAPR